MYHLGMTLIIDEEKTEIFSFMCKTPEGWRHSESDFVESSIKCTCSGPEFSIH